MEEVLKQNNLLSMYRVQNLDDDMNYFLPVKRVIVSKNGGIVFNPDQNRYIYFSRSYRHHAYYVFHKVFSTIRGVLKNNASSQFKLPSSHQLFGSYQTVNVNNVKQIQDFFYNYFPPYFFELVAFDYIKCYSDIFEKCSIKNMDKAKIQGNRIPEISDNCVYGGAYGINDAWLELLRSCIKTSKYSCFSLDDFFDYLIRNSYKAKSKGGVENYTPFYFDLLENLVYTEFKNPYFYDKNNANNVTASITKIQKRKLYNSGGSVIDNNVLNSSKREIKSKIEMEKQD